jgi:hypothetical protein
MPADERADGRGGRESPWGSLLTGGAAESSSSAESAISSDRVAGVAGCCSLPMMLANEKIAQRCNTTPNTMCCRRT